MVSLVASIFQANRQRLDEESDDGSCGIIRIADEDQFGSISDGILHSGQVMDSVHQGHPYRISAFEEDIFMIAWEGDIGHDGFVSKRYSFKFPDETEWEHSHL